MRPGDMVVALADLRGNTSDTLPAMAQLMADHRWLPWLALISPHTAADTREVEEILRASEEYVTSPVDMPRLVEILERFCNGAAPAAETAEIPGMTGAKSSVMRTTMLSLRKYAAVDLPVLIIGETGTGKEVAANALHNLSPRHEHPFVAINCGALPTNLVQSELFGHERGAFTGANARRVGHFEAAAGGTVFLDEIGDLPLDAQTSLLRFLQEGTLERVGSSQSIKMNVRVLAATHVDLEQAVAQGLFREDLYYRLNVLRLRMPPLREREGDVETLAQNFLDAFRQRHHGCAHAFGQGARQAMREFGWPGNVRELLNRVQRAAVVAEGSLISAADLDLAGTQPAHMANSSLDLSRESAEREAVLHSLHASRYNISECARRLHVSRVTVYRLMKKHALKLESLRNHPQPPLAGKVVEAAPDAEEHGSPETRSL